MLKLIPKLLAALVALVLLALVALSFALPRLINSEEFHAALHESAAEALGTPVDWRSLEAGLIPLRLIISDPVLVSETTSPEDARLTASSIDLRISALALLQRRIQIDSLVFRGVEMLVTRTEDGFVLPLASAGEEEEVVAEPAPQDPGEPEPDAPSDDEFKLALRRFAVTESRLVVRDRTLPSPIDWEFSALEFEATGDSLDEPLEVALSARLASGTKPIGGIQANGTMTLSGIYDLDVLLEEVLLEELQPYIADATVAGEMSGKIAIEGASGVVSRVETKLRIEKIAVRSFGLDVAGRLDLEARQTLDQPVSFVADLDLEGAKGSAGSARITGDMSLDGAVDAKVEMKSLELAPFAKLAGTEMEIAGRATGDLALAITAEGGVQRLTTDLNIPDARYSDAALQVAGKLALVLGLEGLGEQDPVRFDMAMDLDGGGHVDAAGTATLGGAVDAKLNVAAVDLARVAAWVPEGSQILGELTGHADVKLAADRRIERLETKVSVAKARLVSEGVDVAGSFDLDARLVQEGPIQLTANLALDDRSRLEVKGTSTVEGVAAVDLKLESFNLAIVKPFLPDPEMKLAGRASGKGRLVGDVTAPEFISLDVGIEGGLLETEDYSVKGPFLANLKVKEPLTRPRGTIDLDLTAASLRYLDQFTKAAGQRAQMITKFVPEKNGEIVFESQLKLRDIDEILLQGAIGDTTKVSMSTSRFNLKGWGDVFPALATYKAEGIIELNGLSVELIEGAPTRFGGRVGLGGVGLVIPDVGPIRLRGGILGQETKIRLQGMKALLGGITFGLEGVVEDPLGKGQFDFAVVSEGDAEVNGLVSALSTRKDVVFGLLKLGGGLQGEFGGSGDLTETLTGDLNFSIGEKDGGLLRGVSILRAVLDQIPLLGGARRLTAPFRGGRSVDDYFTERFEIIEGNFIVSGGKVDARKLRLAYAGYEARLKGPMKLSDLTIDMTGELILKGDLVSTIGGMAGKDIEREPIRIQLAKVTNTLGDPKISMTKETLAAVPKLLFQATGIDTIAIGVGKSVGKAIGRVVGGGKPAAE